MTETNKPKILALIPARGGSKSIPRKNLMLIAGKPLISYSIEQALSSNLITRTIVSTDDDEIAQVARDFGAEVPFMRPSEFAQDLSPDIDVFRHALEWLRDNEGYEPELVVHLRPTGPVRRVELIDRAIEEMRLNRDAHSLRSVAVAVQTPYKMWRINNGKLVPVVNPEGVHEAYNLPRQQLPTVYWQNGYVDIIRPQTILETGSMCGSTIQSFVVDEPMLELDYEEDIPRIVEALRKIQSNEANNPIRTARHPV